MKASKTAQSFYKGDYAKVIDSTVDDPGKAWANEDLALIVGALSFQGRVEEAELLYEQHVKRLTPSQRAACRFFVGIGLCRQSRYERSRAYLGANLLESRKSKDHLTHFYAYQGVAFYRYFCGRFRTALGAAKKAQSAALAAQFVYGNFLSTDLFGHVLVQLGKISAGLKHLDQAAKLAKHLGNGGLVQMMQITTGNYESSYGDDGERSVANLEKLAKTLSPQDSYSQASLLLELARQYTLRGCVEKSVAVLDQACRLVYATRHRRQGVLLNLAYAENDFQIGEYGKALNLLRNTQQQLDPTVDKALKLKVMGMEAKLLASMGLSNQREVSEVAKLARFTGSSVGERILLRSENKSLNFIRGEDKLGDLIDLSRQHPKDALRPILKSKYFSLLYDLLDIPRAKAVLYFDALPGSLIVFDGRGNISFHESVPATLRKLMVQLARGPQTKEQLVKAVWEYQYDPLRHDSLVYTAISRLRTLLPESWIQPGEDGYWLSQEIEVRAQAQEKPVGKITSAPDLGPEINPRQQEILELIKKNQSLDVAFCKEHFNVSAITATRDLASLLQLELVKRVGKGRATRYTLP